MFNKPLVLTLLVSLSLNGLFGYLSYHFYGDKQEIQVKLDQCIESNEQLVESAKKADQVCKIQDNINREYLEEKDKINNDLFDSLDKINKLSSKSQDVKIPERVVVNEKPYVSLDDELPPDLVRLLSESCVQAKGSPCTHP